MEKIIKAKVNELITISLPVNKTTGFSWEIDSSDPDINIEEISYQKRIGGVGVGGVQKFGVKANRIGEFEIRFILKRSWETKVKKKTICRIVIIE